MYRRAALVANPDLPSDRVRREVRVLSSPCGSVTVNSVTTKTSFTIPLSPPQQKALIALLRSGNYRPVEIPHAVIAAETSDCRIALFKSGKCLVQGRGAQDWVLFQLEPNILQEARSGYEDILNPETVEAHMGVDESGKGDFFGPLVIAAAYADREVVEAFRQLNVRDSKTISSDRVAEDMAREIKKVLGRRFAVVPIGPRAYNRLYAKMKNVNHMLAWGHARAIENLLEVVPTCPRAVSDQFGPVRQIESALMQHGRRIKLDQRPRAESDPAVAAASVLARAEFLERLRKLSNQYGVPLPKGTSEAVRKAAVQLIKNKGPEVLLETAKCHFRTTDDVLSEVNLDRKAIGSEATVVSKPPSFRGHRGRAEEENGD